MMPAMKKSTTIAGGALCVLSLIACGGATKQANAPDQGADEMKSSAESTNAASGESSNPTSSVPSQADVPSSGKTAYDKEAVEAQLKRGARSVKASCGSATDEDGQATGPWGKVQAHITLGRNGHVRQVSVPSPYAGTPAGVCVTHAFDKIQFPPYAAPDDVAVDWDVELVKPK
jgi:hypothetical protein